VAAIAAFALSGHFVRNYGMMGAAGIYTIIMCVLTVLLGVILFTRLYKETKLQAGASV
jgi:uncharacterized membrane protein